MEVEQFCISMVDMIGSNRTSMELFVPTLQLTARELINLRVQQEFINAHLRYDNNSKLPEKSEVRNKKGITTQFIWVDQTSPHLSSWEKEAEIAHRAFISGKFFILVSSKQVEGLDTPLMLDPGTTVEFLRLIPLMGG